MLHSVYMAKKPVSIVDSHHKHVVIPSVIGGGIGWIASGTLAVGVVIFITVLIGNHLGHKFLGKK